MSRAQEVARPHTQRQRQNQITSTKNIRPSSFSTTRIIIIIIMLGFGLKVSVHSLFKITVLHHCLMLQILYILFNLNYCIKIYYVMYSTCLLFEPKINHNSTGVTSSVKKNSNLSFTDRLKILHVVLKSSLIESIISFGNLI